MKLSLVVCIAFALFMSNTRADQVRPKLMADLMDAKTASYSSVVTVNNLTPEQKEFYWRNTKRNDNGYLEVQGKSEYVLMIDTVSQKILSKKDMEEPSSLAQAINLNKPLSFEYLGEVKESTNRSSLLFKHSDLGIVMLGLWAFEADRAKIYVIEEFLSEIFNGIKGTLAFVKAPGESHGLWKLSWIANNVNYEFYANDALDSSGAPKKRPEEILKAAKMLCIGKSAH